MGHRGLLCLACFFSFYFPILAESDSYNFRKILTVQPWLWQTLNTRGHKGRGKTILFFFPRYMWKIFAALKITVAFLLLQAALFLGLGVLFSLVSIPLVIYDWACSSSGDEGHWDPPRKRNSPVVYSVKSPHISNLSPLILQVYRSKQKCTEYLKWNNTLVAKQRRVSIMLPVPPRFGINLGIVNFFFSFHTIIFPSTFRSHFLPV